MTKEELLAKIKAEIERLYNGEAPKHDQQCNFDDGYFTGIDTIAQFIDTLESEKPINQERLDENIKHYIEDCGWEKDSTIPVSFVRQIASHFYDLGCRRTAEKYDEIEYNRQRAKESVPKDLEEAAKEYARYHYADTFSQELAENDFLAGSAWNEMHMMKEVVEMEVGMFGKHLPMLIVTEPMEMKDFPAKHGQTVRVIVLPKDDSHE